VRADVKIGSFLRVTAFHAGSTEKQTQTLLRPIGDHHRGELCFEFVEGLRAWLSPLHRPALPWLAPLPWLCWPCKWLSGAAIGSAPPVFLGGYLAA
jgi:hypothetical protein